MKYALLCLGVCAAAAVCLSAASPDFALGRNLQILFNMFREVSLFYVDPTDPDKLLEDAGAGMVARLDPYTELLQESDMDEFKIQSTGKYGGIGAAIRQSGAYMIIAEPYLGFPADKAGLVVGDKLLEVDGESIRGYDATKVSGMLKGDPGTALRLKVEKLVSGDTVEISLRRERIVISSVSYHGVVGDSIGYIVHEEFTEDCSDDIRKAFMELKQQGIKALVLDLRGNGGGSMPETVKILSMFVPKGTEIVSMKGRAKDQNTVFRTQSEPIDTLMPVAVLVNASSASASEIVAGAFQDLDRGVLVGQRTFGKGLVQETHPLGYNAYLKVTTAKYYIPSGRCIQAIDYTHRNEDGSVGFVPDSLIREFRTKAGRRVYDGGGVMPDVPVPPKYVSRFTMALYLKGYLEDFASRYYKSHPEPVDVDRFALSEEDYADFVRFMADKEVDFESETEQALEQLRKKAERDGYLDRIEGELASIGERIKDDKDSELQAFREDITRLIENEIVLRYHYARGVTRHNLSRDNELLEAVRLLQDPQYYNEIVTRRDTRRKAE